jgi:hypothetical protein
MNVSADMFACIDPGLMRQENDEIRLFQWIDRTELSKVLRFGLVDSCPCFFSEQCPFSNDSSH